MEILAQTMSLLMVNVLLLYSTGRTQSMVIHCLMSQQLSSGVPGLTVWLHRQRILSHISQGFLTLMSVSCAISYTLDSLKSTIHHYARRGKWLCGHSNVAWKLCTTFSQHREIVK